MYICHHLPKLCPRFSGCFFGWFPAAQIGSFPSKSPFDDLEDGRVANV